MYADKYLAYSVNHSFPSNTKNSSSACCLTRFPNRFALSGVNVTPNVSGLSLFFIVFSFWFRRRKVEQIERRLVWVGAYIVFNISWFYPGTASIKFFMSAAQDVSAIA
jgi:hypothetical protein